MRILTSVCLIAALLPFSAHAKRTSLALTFGQDVEIISKDDVSLRAACVENAPSEEGDDLVMVYASTTASAAVMEGEDSFSGDGDYLLSTTPSTDSQLLSNNSGDEDFDNDSDEGFVLSLDTLTGFVVHGDSAILAVNPSSPETDADCLISVDIEKIKKFKTVKIKD